MLELATKETQKGRPEIGGLALRFPPWWRVHRNFGGEGYREYITVAVSKQDFKARNQNYSFLVMAYSALFNTESKFFNFFMCKNLATWQ